LIKELRRKIALKKTENEFDRELLQRKFEHIENIKAIINNEKIKNKEQAISLENQLLQIDAADIFKRKLEEQGEEANKLREKFEAIGEEIESSIKNNLRDAITGAQSLGQAMTNVLNKIRDKIIDAQIDNLVGGFGEAFGNGGRPPVGKASIVGEKGPEIFVPRSAGTIIPNNAIDGGGTTNNMITVNVDASGTSVQGSGSQADQLGGLIASVVQATIIDEQRAGGLLNR